MGHMDHVVSLRRGAQPTDRMGMLRRLYGSAIVAILVSTVLAGSPASGVGAGYHKDWAFLLDGWNRSSSPVIADIDGDGVNEVVFGHQDGKLRAYEGDGTLKWETAAIPGTSAECNGQSSASAIDSSPAVADIDGDGMPEIVIGVGSAWKANQNGSVIVFDGATGAIEWAFDHSRDEGNVWNGASPVNDGWCEATYATPAIGDVDGDGHLDVVFASWDFYIWAVDRFGQPLPGFPINNDDTVWSSPALFDVDGDGDMEIFIGGDSTPGGWVDHLGGIFRAIDYKNGAPVSMWNRYANEVFHSSPAIGDINGDGRPEVIVGMGTNWYTQCTVNNHPQCSAGSGSDHTKVWAFHLDDGSDVPGFPVSATGSILSSPALGDVDGDGQLEVVAGSFDHRVYVWNGDGSLLWSVVPKFDHLGDAPVTGHPIIADLDGDGDQDIAVGTSKGLALLDGRDGSSLERGLHWTDKISFAYSHEAAPAVGVLNGVRHLVVTGFDTPGRITRVAAYELPPSSAEDAWPMFRHSATRQGTTSTSPCGHAASSSQFCDVLDGMYYTDAVAWMVGAGITTGISNLFYGPWLSLTRAQMVTFLWRQEGTPTGYAGHGFTDVPAGAYYDGAVRWAKATGITTGTSASTFSPNATVTRAQLVTLLWRRMGEPRATPPPEFVDVPTGRYFSSAVGWARDQEITNGTSALTFSPNDAVTRAQAAAFLYREAGSPPV